MGSRKWSFWGNRTHRTPGSRKKQRGLNQQWDAGLYLEPLEDRSLLALAVGPLANVAPELVSIYDLVSQSDVTATEALAARADDFYVDGDRILVEVRGRGDFDTF